MSATARKITTFQSFPHAHKLYEEYGENCDICDFLGKIDTFLWKLNINPIEGIDKEYVNFIITNLRANLRVLEKCYPK